MDLRKAIGCPILGSRIPKIGVVSKQRGNLIEQAARQVYTARRSISDWLNVYTKATRSHRQSTRLSKLWRNTNREKSTAPGLTDMFSICIQPAAITWVMTNSVILSSGATMNAITEVLVASGASVVYAFAFTQTRRS